MAGGSVFLLAGAIVIACLLVRARRKLAKDKKRAHAWTGEKAGASSDRRRSVAAAAPAANAFRGLGARISAPLGRQFAVDKVTAPRRPPESQDLSDDDVTTHENPVISRMRRASSNFENPVLSRLHRAVARAAPAVDSGRDGGRALGGAGGFGETADRDTASGFDLFAVNNPLAGSRSGSARAGGSSETRRLRGKPAVGGEDHPISLRLATMTSPLPPSSSTSAATMMTASSSVLNPLSVESRRSATPNVKGGESDAASRETREPPPAGVNDDDDEPTSASRRLRAWGGEQRGDERWSGFKPLSSRTAGGGGSLMR